MGDNGYEEYDRIQDECPHDGLIWGIYQGLCSLCGAVLESADYDHHGIMPVAITGQSNRSYYEEFVW